jgi:hypothetical protein
MLASLNIKAKFQLLSLKTPFKYGRLSLKLDLNFFYKKTFTGFLLKVGSSFLLNQLSTQAPSLTCKKHCHAPSHVILGT